MTDIDSARRFVQEHGRLLDRRRFDHLVDGGRAADVIAAVTAYANPDGGFAGCIEPDVRTLTSQPIGALTALDVLHEVAATPGEAVFDWLRSVSPEGGVPFSLPSVEDAAHAPWMASSPAPSLHMTSAVAAAALRAGADHPWIDGARDFCLERIGDGSHLSAYEVKYALDLLDALGAEEALDRVGARIPEDGRLPVQGGVEGESLGLLHLAPRPEHRARRFFTDRQVEAALDELEAGQREDGGWDFDWLRWSPVAAFEWRGRLTVDARATLRAHGR